MDPKTEQMLQMISQPAFFAKDEKICWHNKAAEYLVFVGQSLDMVFGETVALYKRWDRRGPMQTELSFFAASYVAKACTCEDGILFILEKRDEDVRRRGSALLRTSIQLRQILQELLTSGSTIQERIADMDDLTSESELLNRSLYRLLRLCNQLSDGGNLLRNTAMAVFELTDVQEFLDHFAEETGKLLEESGRKLRYIPCQNPIKCNMDRALIGRALYNLLSQGLQASVPEQEITLKAWEDDLQVCFAVSYVPATPQSFATTLGITDHMGSSDGVGADIVRLIAELHGGTVLTSSNPEEETIRTVFSVHKRSNSHTLRSPGLSVDDSYGFHPGLVELSEVLDRELYHPDRV